MIRVGLIGCGFMGGMHAACYAALAEREPDVLFGGRLGEYKYYDMDKVIASALGFAARELN